MCLNINPWILVICINFAFIIRIGGTFREQIIKETHVDVVFSVHDVTSEYIVIFKNYYWGQTRERYIEFAFRKQNVEVSSWRIHQRTKLSNVYPSDFDVVESTAEDVQQILESHPAIKGVSYQHQIQRKLKYTNSNYSNINIGGNALNNRHLLGALPSQITDILDANVLWNHGITGKGIKVAVFDTGLSKEHPHFRNVKERTNWTNEKSLDDVVSHGTFVSGIIASSKECLGLAPDVELHIFRVFTNIQVSYTSWFLDAFNYAMFRKINVLNLSIGGPDFMDKPFVDKVLELSANRVIMVSAIGNDGPLYGTLNNPGDQSDVIGVGGINSDENVAKFSSRGMTTWELPLGYGRLKPDIVTYGSQVKGSNLDGGCRPLSGTSVASPVVAGAVALILSGAPNKSDLINPASVKQILIEGATKLHHNNMFEQGYGKLNVLKSMELLLSYTPKITLSPSYIDFTDSYMWPYSSQPLFCGSMPSIINVTILNGISVRGNIIRQPIWHPYLDKNGEFLNVSISFSPVLWPWTGWMAVKITINEKGCFYVGESRGHISVEIQTSLFEGNVYNYTVNFPVTVEIAAKPPRHKRILWDQFHNLQYPPGYIPRDNLKIKSDPLDWRSDHIHTNFRDMYQHLRNLGYYVETLGMPYTCFNASDYGTLMIVDPEEEFFDEEIYKLQNDVFELGLGVIIFADWYNSTVMTKMKFFDENTREWWVPDTGGANVPALNDVLQGFGISLSDTVVDGYFRLGEHNMYYGSGTTLESFPENDNNIIITANLYDQGSEIINNGEITHTNKIKQKVPVIGLFQMKSDDRKFINISKEFQTVNTEHVNDGIDKSNLNNQNPILNKRVLLQSKYQEKSEILDLNAQRDNLPKNLVNKDNMGRLVIIGDSNCIDSTHAEKNCFWLLNAFLEYTMNSHKSSVLQQFNSISQYKNLTHRPLPKRMKSSRLHKFSKVVNYDNKFKKRSIDKCEILTNSNHQYMNSSEASLIFIISSKDTDKKLKSSLYIKYLNQPFTLKQQFTLLAVLCSVSLLLLIFLFVRRLRSNKMSSTFVSIK